MDLHDRVCITKSLDDHFSLVSMTLPSRSTGLSNRLPCGSWGLKILKQDQSYRWVASPAYLVTLVQLLGSYCDELGRDGTALSPLFDQQRTIA